MRSFKDKVAIMTGGASGIGSAMCKELGKQGAIVIVTDIDEVGAHQVASEINAGGGRAKALHLDVTKAEDVQKVVHETISEYGRLDYMFNNAGIAILGEARDACMDDWHRVIEINQLGVVYGTIAAYEKMIEQGFGHIVNTASYSGLLGYPLCVPYATTKHAIVGLSTSLRLEAAGLGVKVTVICPGPVRTNITKSATVKNTTKLDDAFGQAPLVTIGADKAAKIILKGVARNRAIIVFPFHARLTWWLSRLHPEMVSPGWRLFVSSFRKHIRGK